MLSVLQVCRKFKFECNCHSRLKMTKYIIGHQCWYNIHTMLPECCLNVGLQCWGATFPQCLHNIAWMLSQHWSESCLNVVSTSGPNVEEWYVATTFTQHCYKLGQCCGNVEILVEIQHSYNIVWTSTQRCWDIVCTIWANVPTTLAQHWSVSWLVVLTCQLSTPGTLYPLPLTLCRAHMRTMILDITEHTLHSRKWVQLTHLSESSTSV